MAMNLTAWFQLVLVNISALFVTYFSAVNLPLTGEGAVRSIVSVVILVLIVVSTLLFDTWFIAMARTLDGKSAFETRLTEAQMNSTDEVLWQSEQMLLQIQGSRHGVNNMGHTIVRGEVVKD